MDMTLAAIAGPIGVESAQAIARGYGYQWHREPSDDPFAAVFPG